MKRLLLILCLLLFGLHDIHAERVKVCLFSNSRVSLLNVSFDLGTYNLYGNGDQLLEDMMGEDESEDDFDSDSDDEW